MAPAQILAAAALVLLSSLPVNTSNKNGAWILQALYSTNRRNDEVVVAVCNRFWDYTDVNLIQHIPRPSAHWTLPNRKFHNMIERNLYNNVRTVVVVPPHDRNLSSCLEATFSNGISFDLVEWILHTFDEHAKESLEHATRRTYGKSLKCGNLDDRRRTAGHAHNAFDASRSESPFITYSVECPTTSTPKGVRLELGTPLRNRVLRVACYTILSNNYRPCNHPGVWCIKEALSYYNTTISVSLYQRPSNIIADFSKGKTDVLLEVCAIEEFGLRTCTFSVPVIYTYVTFYAQRGKAQRVALFNVVMESKTAFYLVLVALVSAMLQLATADFMELRFGSISLTLDSMMFFVASFYATSSPIPYTRHYALSRKLVYGVWLAAILPLSNYFRNELTSRLTWLSPPESLDSLDELLHAVDAGSVSLCVVSGAGLVSDLEDNSTGSVRNTKLHAAYINRTKGTDLVKKNTVDCLKCAARKDRVCLTYGIRKWFVDQIVKDTTESKDRLSHIFGATLMRKNFPFARAYDDMIRRLFEAPIRIPYTDWKETSDSNAAPSTQQFGQIEDFAVFFSYFLGFLGTATTCLVAEILIGRCPNRKMTSQVHRPCLRQDQRILTVYDGRHKRVRRSTGPPTSPACGLRQQNKAPIRGSSCSAISTAIGL